MPNIEIASLDGEENKATVFINVNIIDSTGRDAYMGDVLIKGQRIISVGDRLTDDQIRDARVIQGRGRTLMAGMSSSTL